MATGMTGATGGRTLVVVASAIEARAVLEGIGCPVQEPARLDLWTLIPVCEHVDLVVSGVGKAPAAGATARLLDPARHGSVLSVGICGSLPGSDLEIGDAVAATRCVLADEGVQTPDGFTDLGAMGFGPSDGTCVVAVDGRLLERLRLCATAAGPIATVSVCSGTDELAGDVRARTGAVAEAMEGAAVGLSAARIGVAFGELRVVSNTTGDRDAQVWGLKAALAALSRVIGRLS